MSRQATPGFTFAGPDSSFGQPDQKLRGIALSEHAANTNKTRWVQCPTYDIMLLRDKSILESVPYYGSASGSTDIVIQRLQTSNSTNILKIEAAKQGKGEFPAFDDLEGAGVLVEFDDAGMPFIRTCYPRTTMHQSKMPDGRKTAASDSDIKPDSLDALAERIESSNTAKDELFSDATYGVLWTAEKKYVSEDGTSSDIPPVEANSQEKIDVWEAAWLFAWRSGFANKYWSGTIDATNDGQVMHQFGDSGIADDSDGVYLSLQKDAWSKGFRRGDTDAEKEMQTRPAVAEPDNTGAVIPTSQTTGDFADEDATDYEQKAAVGEKTVFYMEKKGVRICVNHDGSFTVDTRSSGQPISIQGGGNGVKLTACGAVIDIGGDNDSSVRIVANSINLGGGQALDAVMFGAIAAAIYNGHYHDETGTVTSPPIQQMDPDVVLSSKVVLS